ncbi:hypothetical protein JCM10449v2_007497 [Rhodotorula kratochvilovae]
MSPTDDRSAADSADSERTLNAGYDGAGKDVPKVPHNRHDSAYLTGIDAEAEREMRDYGGDAPSDLPSIQPARGRSASFAARLQQPHRAPDYRLPPSGRNRSGSTGMAPPVTTRTSRSRQASEDGHDEEPQEEQPDPNKVIWDENDSENPQNWSDLRKWGVTLLCAQATLVVTFASSAPSSTVRQMSEDFGCSNLVGQLATSLFLAGYCAGPLIWAPLSEIIGRRPVFVVSLLIFAIFQIGDALAQNIWTLVIIRFLAATFASSPLTNAGGVIADMFDAVGRGQSMAVFSASVFLGPVCGPIAAGFLVDSYLRWRWIYWIIGIWGLASWVSIAVFLPETYHPALLKKRAERLRKEDPSLHADKYAELEKADFTLKSILKRTLARPAIMLCVEPIVMTVTIYLSILRGFNSGEVGLIFIGIGIGTTLGAILSIYTQRHYRELVPKWHGHPPPEERLWGGMLAGPLLVVGIFWLGWTGNYPSVHWAVPAVSTILIGMSFTLIFISFLAYLVEVYLMFSASALAANTIVRSAIAAAFPLFVQQMFAALGVNWACSLIGFVAILTAPAPFIFYRYGWRLREKSRFAPCLDVGLREQVAREEAEREAERGRTERDEEKVGGEKALERV